MSKNYEILYKDKTEDEVKKIDDKINDTIREYLDAETCYMFDMFDASDARVRSDGVTDGEFETVINDVVDEILSDREGVYVTVDTSGIIPHLKRIREKLQLTPLTNKQTNNKNMSKEADDIRAVCKTIDDKNMSKEADDIRAVYTGRTEDEIKKIDDIIEQLIYEHVESCIDSVGEIDGMDVVCQSDIAAEKMHDSGIKRVDADVMASVAYHLLDNARIRKDNVFDHPLPDTDAIIPALIKLRADVIN